MLAQLLACHLAPNAYSVGSLRRCVRNCDRHQRQHAVSGICSRSSSTAAAAAEPARSGWQPGDFNGLGALLRSGQLSQAVDWLDNRLNNQQRLHGLPTGELLEALCRVGQHSTAWRLLPRVTAAQGRLPLQVLHRLLKLAGQFGTVEDVLAVYEHQQRLYGFASAEVQTTLIHALLKAGSKGQPGHLLAYEAWGRLRGSGKQLDAQALLAGVHACVCVGQFRQADALLEPLKAAAGAAGLPVVSAFNIIIKGHVAASNLDAARKTFGAMRSRGLAPDVVTYNTLLSGFVRAGDMSRAQALVRTMQVDGVAPDAWTFTTLALGYGRLGQLEHLQEAVRQMEQAGVPANSATYMAVVDALASAGHMQQAEQLLLQMQGHATDVQALSSGLSVQADSSGSAVDQHTSRSSTNGQDTTRSSTQDSVWIGQPSSSTPGISPAGSMTPTPGRPSPSSFSQGELTVRRPLLSTQPDSRQLELAQGTLAAPAAVKVMPRAPPSSLPTSSSVTSSSVTSSSITSRPGHPHEAWQGAGQAPQQQQGQQQLLQTWPSQAPPSSQQPAVDVAGGTRSRQQVLRQQYNSLIKGWLQLAAAQQLHGHIKQQGPVEDSSSHADAASSSCTTSSAAAAPCPPPAVIAAGKAAAQRVGGLAAMSERSDGLQTQVQQLSITGDAQPAAAMPGLPSSAQAVAVHQQQGKLQQQQQQPWPQQQQPRPPPPQQVLSREPSQQGGVQQAAASQPPPLQPVLQRRGVSLLRPVLPSQPAAASAPAVLQGIQGSQADASAQNTLHQQQQQQQQWWAAVQPEAASPSAAGVAAVTGGDGQGRQPWTAAAPDAPASGVTAYEEAVRVLQRMQAAGVAPAADTYTLFINHCILVGDASRLQQLLDTISAAGIRPDQVMLTSLIKAAWQAEAHGAAVELFNALLRITSSPSRRSSRSGSSSSSSSAGGSSAGSPSASLDGYSSSSNSGGTNTPSFSGNGSGFSAGVSSLPGHPPTGSTSWPDGRTTALSDDSSRSNSSGGGPVGMPQRRLSLSQALRGFARAAAADASRPTPPGAGWAAGNGCSPAGAEQQQQQQQASLQAELQQQLQEQILQAMQQHTTANAELDPPTQLQEQHRDMPPSPLQQKQQQQQPRRFDGQILLPLSAPVGPDSTAWNALVAALVKAGQLDKAATALERSTQASAAAGACRPPLEGYSALIRGYRRAGQKGKAVAALRQFLNLGGRPGRVMCDDVISLCLDARDIRTARQVVRAMELTGSLDGDSSSLYEGWFRRWEQQQQQQLNRWPTSAAGPGVAPAGGDWAPMPDSSNAGSADQQGPAGGSSNTVAVERLKWWLGLPNSYYRGAGDRRGPGGPP